MSVDNKVYIFIAKDSDEFAKYPDSKDGYFVNKDFRLPYKYKKITDNKSILVLDSFAAKDKFKEYQHKGKFVNRDAYLRFLTIVFSVVKRVTGLNNSDYEAKIFVHFGGLEIEVAKTLIGIGKSKENEFKKKFENSMADQSVKDFYKMMFPKWDLFPISSTDSSKPLDLSAPKISLKAIEQDLNTFLDKFLENEGETFNDIKSAFEIRWNIDSNNTNNDKSKAEYRSKAEKLNIIVKEC